MISWRQQLGDGDSVFAGSLRERQMVGFGYDLWVGSGRGDDENVWYGKDEKW